MAREWLSRQFAVMQIGIAFIRRRRGQSSVWVD
jgi:hypothetical protein